MKDWCPQMHILEQAAAQAGRPLRLAQKELLSKQLMGGDLLAALGTGRGFFYYLKPPVFCRAGPPVAELSEQVAAVTRSAHFYGLKQLRAR